MTDVQPARSRSRRKDVASRLLFAIGFAVLMFGAGVHVGKEKSWPYEVARSALSTAKAWQSNRDLRNKLADRRERAQGGKLQEPRRIEVLGAGGGLADPVLLQSRAGWSFFRDEAHSIAYQYEDAGRVTRAWPYFPDSIGQAEPLVDWPHQLPLGSTFADYAEFESSAVYANGDLLVVLRFGSGFPTAGGVARISPRGGVAWYRREYSHHQAYLTKAGVALVPTYRELDREEAPDDPYFAKWFARWPRRTMAADYVHAIDGTGALLEEIPVLEALTASPWRRALDLATDLHGEDMYSPTHLNFVHEVGTTASGSGVADIEPGDLVLSLRNFSSFAIMDRESHRLKRWASGTWRMQHSVHHLEGSRYIMFDNHGGVDPEESRVLTVDLATGVERVVFPTEQTPPRFRGLLSWYRGYLSVSPDRKRVLATFHTNGTPCSPYIPSLALELRIADGAVLAAICTSRLASYVAR